MIYCSECVDALLENSYHFTKMETEVIVCTILLKVVSEGLISCLIFNIICLLYGL